VPLDVAKLRNIGGDSDRRKSIRAFGLNGKPFPRLVISVWDAPLGDGWKIVASRKDGSGAWWCDCAIPYELLAIIPAMVSEVLKQNVDVL
jgi:hypothetical protein